MIKNEFRILLIDDDEDDFIHIRDLLNDVTFSKYKVYWEPTYSGGLEALQKESFDVCLLDYKLGEKTGLDLLVEAKTRTFTYPIIFLTGLGDFELDVQAMERGASDYLVKNQLTYPLLERSIRYSIKRDYDYEELKNTKALLLQQDRLASLGLLASSLAHEIGTPLGIIRSRAELIEKKTIENESLKKDMTVVITQIDRITKLVNSLLHLARGGKSDHVTSVSLDQVIEDVLNLLEPEFVRKNILLKKELALACRVKAESGPLGQVLLNLLINAIHAIEEAKKMKANSALEVTLKVVILKNQTQISIQDTGVGISEENKSQLFKPFFTTKDIGQGTGLGLATSLGIINSWGGTISVVSQVGIGTTFTFLLSNAE
jgi:signal transduction histidine kinase